MGTKDCGWLKVAKDTSHASYFVRNPKWESVWLLPHKFFVTNKVKETSFKIISQILSCKTFLSKFKKDIDVNCSFCSLHLETVPHISGTVVLLKVMVWSLCVYHRKDTI